MPVISKRMGALVAAMAVVCAPGSTVATELTLDQIQWESNLFGGDIDTEYHQVQDAFGTPTATRALGLAGLRYDRSLDTPEGQRRRLGAANINGATMWNGATMRYAISADFGGGAAAVALLEAAMKEITDKTGIKFEASTQGSYITYVDGAGCSSAVGDRNPGRAGTQPVTLKSATPQSPGNCRIQGIVVHELLHALGLWHQQSATDRDTYVKVYPDRIRPQNLFNFDKLRATNNYVGYAYSSIMHYGRTAFSITQGVNVMEAVDPTGAVNLANTQQMGQRSQLDPTDAIELQIMYHCHIANPTAGLIANQPAADIKDLCTAACPCAENQGGCKTNTDCTGDLVCAQNVGVYEHLGQRTVVPGLNACQRAAAPAPVVTTPAPVATAAPVAATAAPVPVVVTGTPTNNDLLSTAKPSTQAPSPSAIAGAPTPFDLTVGGGGGEVTIIPPVPQQVGIFTVGVQARDGVMTMEVSMQGTAGWMSVAFEGSHANGIDSVTCVLDATTPAVYDTYAGQGRAHRLDATQDTTLISAAVAGGTSTCSFSRKLTTGDASDAVLTMGLAKTLNVAYGTGAVTVGAANAALNYNMHPAGGYTGAQVTINAAKVSSSGPGATENVNGEPAADSSVIIAIGSAAGLLGVAGVVTMARRKNAASQADDFYTPPTSYNMSQGGGQPQQQMGYYPQQQQMASANPMFGAAL